MRYLLVLGFFCDVYRREPRARLYFNNQLIDEFLIQHYTKNKDFKIYTKHILEPIPAQKRIEHFQQLLPPLRFYELNTNRETKYANISINIDNDDNNFTNGFMREKTLLQCRIMLLLPKDKSIHDRFVHQMRHRKIGYRYPWFWRAKINQLVDLSRSIEWLENNGKKIINEPLQFINYSNIGGSGSLHCELIKKYGVWFPKLSTINKPYLYQVNGIYNNIIYDKYRQHENI